MESETFEFVIADLEPDTSYVVSLRAGNDHGTSAALTKTVFTKDASDPQSKSD